MEYSIEITPGIAIRMSELTFRASRSGGPGGQNVNKVETRVEIEFDIRNSSSLPEKVKSIILEQIPSRISRDGVLRVVAQESRSQWENRRQALKKLRSLLQRALKPRKHRVATKPTAGAREKRLRSKKLRSERKKQRRTSLE